jgi:sortase A
VSVARRATGVVGEVLITAGVLVLLFLVYQLVWTNLQADRAAEAKTDGLIETWERESRTGPEFERPLPRGEAFALLYIPRLGDDYRVPIVQGVRLEDLAAGVGHYPATALPGRVGNFAVAGHRATNGEPFASLDQLRTGDAVVVETRTTWYTYTVTKEYIVPPTQVEVILPVPNEPDVEPKRALMTLTTCNPRWASYERLIFHATLTETLPKGEGRPAALGGGA